MQGRSQIQEKYKWDLTEYCPNLEKWEEEYNFVKDNYKKLEKYEGKLNNKETIKEFLNEEKEIGDILSRLYVFSSLKTKEDATNTKYQDLLQRISILSTEISSATSFVSVEFANLSDEMLEELSNDLDLKDYDLFFKDIIKTKKHTLSKPEEKLLSLMGDFADGFSENFDMFENADVKFEDVTNSKGEKLPLNQSTYSVYFQSEDRELRRTAIKNMNKAYGDLNYTLASNYINQVKIDCFSAKVRKHKSSLEQSLFGEEVSRDVYKTLIKSVCKNLPKFYKYYDLKRKLLKLDKIANYDMAAPTNQKFDLNYSYEQGLEIVKKACSPLGDDYIKLLDKSKEERWTDVMPNKGKDSGAFSWGCYDCHPVVLLNWTNTTDDVFTLAHELGHAMHTYHSNKAQPRQKAGYEIFVAEVASTVNEMLLCRYLLQNAKCDEEKMFCYDHILKMFRTTILRQTMFAEFEDYAHETYEQGIPLSAELLNDYYFKLNEKYFGDNVELLPEMKYEWSRIPHFYNSFYVYKYATGLISAIIISEKLFNKENNARENYIKFLSSGSIKPPVELLKIAGVNLEKEETFDLVFDIMQNYLTEYEKLINNM